MHSLEEMAGSERQQPMMSMEAFLNRVHNYTAPDPSSRNPRISRESNYADQIEDGLQADGHQTWGYVIYRTTYESDADWAEFMRRLRFWTAENMETYNGQDVLEKMSWTVFDDRQQLDGADVASVRGRFTMWAETAILLEQQIGGRQGSDVHVVMGQSPRYRYCIQVDAASLQSVIDYDPPVDNFAAARKSWVKLIAKDWVPISQNPRLVRRPSPDANIHDPIEGVTEHHIGWVKCPMPSVMVDYYFRFRDLNGYTISYRRPPAILDLYDSI